MANKGANEPRFGGTRDPYAKSPTAGAGNDGDADDERRSYAAGVQSTNQQIARVPYPRKTAGAPTKGRNRVLQRAKARSVRPSKASY